MVLRQELLRYAGEVGGDQVSQVGLRLISVTRSIHVIIQSQRPDGIAKKVERVHGHVRADVSVGGEGSVKRCVKASGGGLLAARSYFIDVLHACEDLPQQLG